jgi:hypothetical protein
MKYKFKNYVFDDESQLLSRPDRSQVWLREQAGALLTALLRRPGELVTKSARAFDNLFEAAPHRIRPLGTAEAL